MPTPVPGGGTQRGQTEGPSPSLAQLQHPSQQVTAGHVPLLSWDFARSGPPPGVLPPRCRHGWAVPRSPCHRWGPTGLLLSPSAPPSDAVCLPVPAGCSHPWLDLTSSPITCPGVFFFFLFLLNSASCSQHQARRALWSTQMAPGWALELAMGWDRAGSLSVEVVPGFGISSWDGSITHPVLSSEHPCAAVC